MRFLPLYRRETGMKQIAKFPHNREYQGIPADEPPRQTQICGVTKSVCRLIKFRKPIFGARRK